MEARRCLPVVGVVQEVEVTKVAHDRRDCAGELQQYVSAAVCAVNPSEGMVVNMQHQSAGAGLR